VEEQHPCDGQVKLGTIPCNFPSFPFVGYAHIFLNYEDIILGVWWNE